MKIWTEPELLALKQRYPYEANPILAKEFSVIPHQLRKKAFALGVKKIAALENPRLYRNRRAHQWTEAQDDLILQWWPVISNRAQRGKNSEWLAQQLGVSVVQVRTRAAALGLRKMRQKEPPWAEKELELLDQWLHLTPLQIRGRLKRRGYARSEAAITVQRFKRFGGLANATGGYSAHQLARWLGISPAPVLGWIKKGWLKADPRGDTMAANGGPGDRWNITPKAIKEFLFDNAALINSRGINFVWLMDLLKG